MMTETVLAEKKGLKFYSDSAFAVKKILIHHLVEELVIAKHYYRDKKQLTS